MNNSAQPKIAGDSAFLRPVMVDHDADADAMNRLHGESYGVDWAYMPAAASRPPGAGTEAIAALQLLLPMAELIGHKSFRSMCEFKEWERRVSGARAAIALVPAPAVDVHEEMTR